MYSNNKSDRVNEMELGNGPDVFDWLIDSNSITISARWSVGSHCRLASGSTWRLTMCYRSVVRRRLWAPGLCTWYIPATQLYDLMSVWRCFRLLERPRRNLPNGMLKSHLPSAELDCVQTDGRSYHRYRRDECNSELCSVPIRSPYGSPLEIILLKLASLASQDRNIQFVTLF